MPELLLSPRTRFLSRLVFHARGTPHKPKKFQDVADLRSMPRRNPGKGNPAFSATEVLTVAGLSVPRAWQLNNASVLSTTNDETTIQRRNRQSELEIVTRSFSSERRLPRRASFAPSVHRRRLSPP